jgi:hypothetical protein
MFTRRILILAAGLFTILTFGGATGIATAASSSHHYAVSVPGPSHLDARAVPYSHCFVNCR